MMASVDGRIKTDIWKSSASGVFEEIAAKLPADAWLVGRTTMQEFSSKEPPRKRTGTVRVPAGDFISPTARKPFAVAIDPQGKCHWDTDRVSGDHVIEVLTEQAPAAYLDHLRAANVSYVFGGKRALDLRLVLEKLRHSFGIRRVRIDGGGAVNGSVLEAGLIDEFSLLLAPLVDGTTGTPAVFDIAPEYGKRTAKKLALQSVRRLRKGVLWLRYRVRK
jgi:riboflavin biosynthesis pyrimidine reductase